MGTCGATLRKLSIFILIAAIIVLGVHLFTSLAPINDEREEFIETQDNHDDYHDSYYADSRSDCETCDRLEESEKALDRATTLVFTDVLHKMLWIAIGCAFLFGIGEVAENLCNVESHTASKRYSEKPYHAPGTDSESGLRSTMGTASATFCTKCGTSLRPGSEFCSICGTTVKK